MVKRMFDAHRHPSIVVSHCAMLALADPFDTGKLNNLARWLDRVEPGWKIKRRVFWSDH
jgi:hypothetical protein